MSYAQIINKYEIKPQSKHKYSFVYSQNTLFPTLITNMSSWMYSKSGISCASTTLLARGPTCKPIPLVVLLHGLPRPSSELLARIRTAYPPFLLWTPSLIHPNKSTSSELNSSHSACGPPITNSSLMTKTKHIPNPMDLIYQAQTPQTHAYNFL